MIKTPFSLRPASFTIPPAPPANLPSQNSDPIVCAKVLTWLGKNKDVDAIKLRNLSSSLYQNAKSYKDSDDCLLMAFISLATGVAPWDLGYPKTRSMFIPPRVLTLLNTQPKIYSYRGNTLIVERYWTNVLSQTKIEAGSATTTETHNVTKGTSLTDTHAQEVASAWQVETHKSAGASASVDFGWVSASVTGEISRGETNSGSSGSSISSQFELSQSESIQHTFDFKPPQAGEPSPIDLTWWQLMESTKLGQIWWISFQSLDGFFDSKPSDQTQPFPICFETPRSNLDNGGGWCELLTRWDTFQLSKTASS